MAKKKVAVLGGGIGALTTAFQLSNTPNWKDELEITVYQVGWRLGGKCATSRNPAVRNRIEEHGIHYLLGFYENAFHVIRQMYDECRTQGVPAPFGTWEEAFRRQSVVTAMVEESGGWNPFGTIWPTFDGDTPGDPERFRRREHPPTGLGLIAAAFRLARQWAADVAKDSTAGLNPAQVMLVSEVGGWMNQATEMLQGFDVSPAAEGPDFSPAEGPDVRRILALLERSQSALADPVLDPVLSPVASLSSSEAPFELLAKPTLGDHARYLLIMLDIVVAMGRGMTSDMLFGRDFSKVDGIEFRRWLSSHGCRFPDFAVIRSGYDACFAYLGGDSAQHSMSAAVALNGSLRLWLTYRGAIFWPMRAGMAEVIFSPLYRLLRHRGVKFEFFHRVRELRLSPDKTRVDRIDIDIQAHLKNGVYDPLVRVGQLECWPDAPLYEQLADPAAIQGDMESAWAAPTPVGTRTLKAGTDFDAVVFGIALGAVPHLCPELVAASPAWRTMVANVPTVQTQALQLWMHLTSEQCGYDPGTLMPSTEPPCVSAFVKPFDTYVDQTDTKDFEEWSAADDVRHVAYFCTTFPDATTIPAPGTDPTFPAREHARVRANASAFIEKHLPALFPNTARGVPSFNWDMLVDIHDRKGEARLDGQFFRANIDPSARYVLSPPNAIAARLKPDDSKFANLFLAGDWTFTPMNSGCVEAATMSGLRAAQAVSGKPVHIYGWR